MRAAFLVVAVTLLVAAGPPAGSAHRAGGGLVALVTAEGENSLVAVSLPDGRVIRRVTLPADPENVVAQAEGPAVVVSSKGHAVTVLAWHSLRIVATFRDFRSPHLAAITPDAKWAYVTDDGTGYLSVIDLARLRLVRRLYVGLGAHHLSFSGDGRRLWIALGERARRIVVVNTATSDRPRVRTTFDPGFAAHDLAFSPDGRRVWVTSDADGGVRVLDAATHHLHYTVLGGTPPQHLAFGRGDVAYVTSGYGNTIEMVDSRNGRVLRRVAAPHGSFNVTTLAGTVLTSSLLRGTVAEFDSRLHLLRTVEVASATRDVAGSVWP